jgi:2-oxoisovalerate dehydrogenase E1 component
LRNKCTDDFDKVVWCLKTEYNKKIFKDWHMEISLINKLYYQMASIRIFEETLLELFSQGKISGTTHTYLGQEAIAVSSMIHVKDGDAVFSNHRCHGHFIAYGGNIKDLFSEILGFQEGVCAGRGGSQHLQYKSFFTNGIQGGMLPNAAGYALASKLRNENYIAVVFIGDGTFGEGIVYETMNIVSLWDIPILIIVEDNGYAQTTPKSAGLAGTIYDRVNAFRIKCNEIESNDFAELYAVFECAFNYVRTNKKPFCQIVKTYRMGPHSKGDDFRDQAEIEKWREKDPLILAQKYIEKNEILKIQETVREEISNFLKNALSGTAESSNSLLNGISRMDLGKQRQNLPPQLSVRFVESLNSTLHYIFETQSEAIIIGEDIIDPYGGAFKVTKGLSTKFPNRVLSTPISELSIAGIANGLALNKMRAIVEVMFGDFITLMYDQILNHGAKFKWIYNNKVNTPVLIRMPTGGKRGYGPTHSQSLEKIFLGIPNITVISPTIYHNPGQLLLNAYLLMETPVIFIENKSFYAEKLIIEQVQKAGNFYIKKSNSTFPTLLLSPESSDAEVSIICYGGGIIPALSASWQLMIKEEINVEVVCPSLISPLPIDEIYSMLSNKSKIILILDEEYVNFGWSSEVAFRIYMIDNQKQIRRTVENMGMKKTFISSSKSVEDVIFPSEADIIKKIKTIKSIIT